MSTWVGLGDLLSECAPPGAGDCGALPESLFRVWSVHRPGSFTFRPGFSELRQMHAPVPFDFPFENHSLCLVAFYLFPRNKLKFNPHTRAGELSLTFSGGECEESGNRS